MIRYLSITTTLGLLMLMAFPGTSLAEDRTAVIAPVSEEAEGLDLQAVAALFQESKDVEDFERRLNDEKTGVNNLDLDGDDGPTSSVSSRRSRERLTS